MKCFFSLFLKAKSVIFELFVELSSYNDTLTFYLVFCHWLVSCKWFSILHFGSIVHCVIAQVCQLQHGFSNFIIIILWPNFKQMF